MNRRQLLLTAFGALGHWHLPGQASPEHKRKRASAVSNHPDALQDPLMPRGNLMIIGGAEDRTGSMLVLRRFIELAKPKDPQIAVLTAASAFPDIVWERYDRVLADLGVVRRVHIRPNTREESSDPQWISLIQQSDGVLLTGGDQRRLASLIGGTDIERAIDHAYRAAGACIAGTSAGAAVMSQDMLVGRAISNGIGLLRGAIIDQHFSERRRLMRLLSAVAKNPRLIGIGVDEDTALIIGQGREIEVAGSGGVTIVDGRRLPTPAGDVDPEQLLLLPGLEVYSLPKDALLRPGSSAPGRQALLPEQHAALRVLREVLPSLTRTPFINTGAVKS
jgi:cyanophycinase